MRDDGRSVKSGGSGGICAAAARLGEKDKKAIEKALRQANRQCRYVIELCSDPKGIAEKRLLDIIENTDSEYIRDRAIGRLDIRPEYEDKQKIIDLLKRIEKKVDTRDPYRVKAYSKLFLKKLGVEIKDETPEGTKPEGTQGEPTDGKQNLKPPRGGGRGGDSGPEQQDGGRPSEHGKRKNDPDERGTVWLAVGAGVTVAVVALLEAKALRKT
ncbi:MAG: hypothetical protein HY897_09860 [Deltaproteobacteria bacterium]|nr:hypothetical protein [Deltaproteobacteria bacterium]